MRKVTSNSTIILANTVTFLCHNSFIGKYEDRGTCSTVWWFINYTRAT